jgi:hypothetical protein
METRIDKLESTVESSTAQIASLREDLAVIKSNYVTKEDLVKLESTILKVFITTAIMLTGLVFGIVRYAH